VEHAQEIADNAPPGWKYLSTWLTVRGFGRSQCETRWELDDYSALGAGFGTERFQKLGLEFRDFVDSAEGGETYLMKSASDIAIVKGAD